MKKLSFHDKMSYIKSGIRVVGYIFLVIDLRLAASLLLLAEMFGVFEEFHNPME